MAETPEIVVPLDQVPYNSTVSGHLEYLPVTVDIMAAKGCDYVVLDLVKSLQVRSILYPHRYLTVLDELQTEFSSVDTI